MVEEERNETLYKAVGSLPEIQRRRFLLYYEYEFNFYQIAAMEHCTASAIQKSVAIAKEKVKAEIEEISPTVTDTARKRNLFFICVGLAALHTLTFFRGSKSIFKEVNAYVQRKQKHRPKGGKPCRSYRQSTPKRSFITKLLKSTLFVKLPAIRFHILTSFLVGKLVVLPPFSRGNTAFFKNAEDFLKFLQKFFERTKCARPKSPDGRIGIVSSIQMIRQFIYISVVSPGGGRAFFDKSITVGFCRYAFCFMAATSFSRRFQQ